MNCYDNTICERIKTITAEVENYINLVYAAPCMYTRNMLLYQLRAKMNEIDFLSGMICCQMQVSPAALPQQNQQNQRDLILQELAKFNGKMEILLMWQ